MSEDMTVAVLKACGHTLVQGPQAVVTVFRVAGNDIVVAGWDIVESTSAESLTVQVLKARRRREPLRDATSGIAPSHARGSRRTYDSRRAALALAREEFSDGRDVLREIALHKLRRYGARVGNTR